MKTAVVCYYADVGRPYLPLIEQMTASVKRVIPDAIRVLLTPTQDCKAAPYFDHVEEIKNRQPAIPADELVTSLKQAVTAICSLAQTSASHSEEAVLAAS